LRGEQEGLLEAPGTLHQVLEAHEKFVVQFIELLGIRSGFQQEPDLLRLGPLSGHTGQIGLQRLQPALDLRFLEQGDRLQLRE
jgi:hypothetical protein